MRLVYFAPVPWASFAQRPHKFVEWFQGMTGNQVLWIDPYPTRLPSWGDLRRVSAVLIPVEKGLPDWLTVLKPRALPIEPLPFAGKINILLWIDVFHVVNRFIRDSGCNCMLAIGKPSELALQVLIKDYAVPSLYDAMDDFSAFYTGLSRIAMTRRERTIVAKVSKVLASSTALADRLRTQCGEVIFTPNACSAESLPPISSPRKADGQIVLGYVGTIGHWFDWSVVFALARVNPSVCIRLIGPIYFPPQEPMPNNIELRPACDHAAAVAAIRQFTVGLIPFKRTRLTASVDPIKYYEYRALGLPVIATAFGEMALRDRESGVFLVRQHTNLVDLVNAAIAYEPNKNELQRFRTENSWNARFSAAGILP